MISNDGYAVLQRCQGRTLTRPPQAEGSRMVETTKALPLQRDQVRDTAWSGASTLLRHCPTRDDAEGRRRGGTARKEGSLRACWQLPAVRRSYHQMATRGDTCHVVACHAPCDSIFQIHAMATK